MEDYKFLFKIVLVGNSGVGKTCLIRRFTKGVFPDGQYSSIGIDFMIKTLTVNGIRVKLQIWDIVDTGGCCYRRRYPSWYKGAHSLILVYDISSQSSFDSLPHWCRDIDQYGGVASGDKAANRNPFKVLVGNKCDKDREVPTDIAEKFAEHNNFDLFMETSALQAENVEKLFREIAEILVEKSQAQSSITASTNSSLMNGRGQSDPNKSSCMSCQIG